jgi:hypothetical protein
MRKTTNYKRYERGGAVPLDVQINTPSAHIAADANTGHLLRAVTAGPAASIDIDHDDASKAFQVQIDALRRSEEIQRQRAAQAASALTLKEQAFLKDNPDFLDDHEIAHKALMKAHQGGHVPDSDEFHSAVKAHWQALKPPADIAKAKLSPSSLALPDDLDDLAGPIERTRNVSAPVSRETQANGSYNSFGERPGRITLSAAQREAARFSGLTEREYAEQLIRLREEKKNGNYHGGQP